MSYATVFDLQQAINPAHNAEWEPADIEIMEIALKAASEWIDTRLGTTFIAGEEETRYYTAESATHVSIDDSIEITSVRTDTTGNGVYDRIWTPADYYLLPFNALAKRQPYREIVSKNWQYLFPTWPGAVEVTGRFGYSETPPAAIVQATLLIAQRLYKRREAIFGVGSLPGTAGGIVTVVAKVQEDADIVLLLSSIQSRVYV